MQSVERAPDELSFSPDVDVLSSSPAVLRNETRYLHVALLCNRVGLGLVFTIFGIDKILSPSGWSTFVPGALHEELARLGVAGTTFLWLLGLAECLLGLQLVLGLLTRWTAGLAAAALAVFVLMVGFGGLGIRDLGLLGGALGLCFSGGGRWSIDSWIRASARKE
jgi:uncharacterized membrane protein YphA (DoxX/SURF4 family)